MKNNMPRKKFPGMMEDLKPTHTHTHTDNPTHTDTPVVRERKNRRVQLLMKESTVDALDAYAKRNDISRNEIIQGLVDKFLSENV